MARSLFIFDLDGTLVDSTADLTTAVNLTRADIGLGPLPLDTVAGFVGDGVRRLVERALADAPGVDLEAALRAQKRHYLAHLCDRTRPYPGVPEGLRALQQRGNALAVATNKPVDMTEKLLAALDIRPFFGTVCGGGSVPELKPHPAVIELILARAGLSGTRAWMVGDHRTDLEAARRAGVRSVWMRYGIGQPGGETPDLAFDSFGAFVSYFTEQEEA